MTEEHKNKIRQALIGNKNSLGIKHSAEWTRKIANSLIGQKRTEESRKKMSLSHIGVRAGMTGKKQSLETKAKISASRKGKNCGERNWIWKGGKSRNERRTAMDTFEYKQWRVSVFERDHYTCQVCRKVGGYLVAHHIKRWADYPELRLAIINGITLCEACHRLTDNYGRRAKV